MPRKNGAETIVEIRSKPEFEELKVFAVSGSDRDELDVPVGPRGVNRWFTKPLDARQLVEEMDRGTSVCVNISRMFLKVEILERSHDVSLLPRMATLLVTISKLDRAVSH